ncbi:MAG: helix-turn-helix transcriptional regulator [Bacteroidales bacterium]|nr:helix-turn-helix transcriptional regulator [Bacteroidales bacterium]
MYTLKESWHAMFGAMPMDNWDGKMYCIETDAAKTFRSNETQGYLSAYTFTLVTQGWLTFIYNGKVLTLNADDLYFYSPGLSVTIVSASENYRAICLLADEHTTIDMPTVRDLVGIACLPVVQLHEPKLTLPHATALHLASRMREIIAYLHSDHLYRQETLRMLYALFLLDVQNAQQRVIVQRPMTRRVEDIFIGFIRLLPAHFARHRNIAFYAGRLNISPVYLSRVVRQVSGRTVVDYVNQMLLMEASFLLRTTSMGIAQIADRLNFADASSFSKFFSRRKVMSPWQFRAGADTFGSRCQ